MKNVVLSLSFFSMTLLMWSCGGGSKGTFETVESAPEEVAAPSEEEAVVEEAEAVCLWENLSLREAPSGKGKWITSISLGEVVTFTGETALDSAADKTYYKVKLNGGKEGWSQANFLELNSTVGVFTENTEVYKRPDLLTKAGKKFSSMDIIAVKNTQGDWVEVRGKRSEGKYLETGWVKGNNISNKDIDVATAKFGAAALSKDSPDEMIEALKDIVENGDLAASAFIPVLQEKLTELTTVPDEPMETIQEAAEQAADSIQ